MLHFVLFQLETSNKKKIQWIVQQEIDGKQTKKNITIVFLPINILNLVYRTDHVLYST